MDKQVDLVKSEFNNIATGKIDSEKQARLVEILDNCKRKKSSLFKEHEELVAREKNNFTTLGNTSEETSSSYPANSSLEQSEERSIYLDLFIDVMPYSEYLICNRIFLFFILFIIALLVLNLSKFNVIINKLKKR